MGKFVLALELYEVVKCTRVRTHARSSRFTRRMNYALVVKTNARLMTNPRVIRADNIFAKITGRD